MVLSFEQVHRCFIEARRWFGGEDALGASNKTYSESAPQPPEKIAKRNTRAEAANLAIRQMRAAFGGGRSILDYGASIYFSQFKAGNCQEMSALAAYLIKSMYPPSQVFAVSIEPSISGKHMFISVNEHPLGDNISSGFSSNGAIIVDVWLNICCSSEEYSSKVRPKLPFWRDGGKLVHGHLPTNQQFTKRLFGTRISYSNALKLNWRPWQDWGYDI